MQAGSSIKGEVLGHRYRLVRCIADGVPARYQAVHPGTRRTLAAALWPPTPSWKELRRGAAIATTLRHRGVVQLIDFSCRASASQLLIYEPFDGERLSEILARSGGLPPARVADLVESLAWTLMDAHQQGVVHQELRTEQVYVVGHARGAREWTKLDGFGVAAALVRAGFSPASPYRAPGRAAAAADSDAPDDQYALAAMAREMLTGSSAVTTEAAVAPPLTGAADVVIRQALAPEPSERFADVLEFALALRRSLEARSTARVRVPALPPPSTPGRLNAIAGAVARRLSRAIARRLRSVPAPAALAVATFAVGLTIGALVPRGRPSPAVAAAAGASGSARNRAERPRLLATALRVPQRQPSPQPPATTSAASLLAPAGPQRRAATARPVRHARAAIETAPAPAPTSDVTELETRDNGKGNCLMSLESTPSAAQVWLDGRDTGRRTPLFGYRVSCGDHKLLLRRGDLELSQGDSFTANAAAPVRKAYVLDQASHQ
jgi:serine/threonine-protein kinase